jgi:hypothetical protein
VGLYILICTDLGNVIMAKNKAVGANTCLESQLCGQFLCTLLLTDAAPIGELKQEDVIIVRGAMLAAH